MKKLDSVQVRKLDSLKHDCPKVRVEAEFNPIKNEWRLRGWGPAPTPMAGVIGESLAIDVRCPFLVRACDQFRNSYQLVIREGLLKESA